MREHPAGKIGNRSVDINEIFPQKTLPEQVYSEESKSDEILI